MKVSKGVLSNINVKRKIDLTPKCKHIFTRTLGTLNKIKKRNAVLKPAINLQRSEYPKLKSFIHHMLIIWQN